MAHIFSPSVGLSILHQLAMRKMPHRHASRPVWWRQLFDWGSLFPGGSSWQSGLAIPVTHVKEKFLTCGGNKGSFWGLLFTICIPLTFLPVLTGRMLSSVDGSQSYTGTYTHRLTCIHSGLGEAPMMEHLLHLRPPYPALSLWSSTWNAQGTIKVSKGIWLLLWQSQKKVNHGFCGNANDTELGFNFSPSVSPIQISTQVSKSASILFLHVCFACK